MKHGSLFSGIGGFDLAASWMGWENVFSCDINEFGNKILKYYWPNAIHYEDINKTDFNVHRGGIDILTGGFPCQPFSQAGKRKGTDDDRHLWPRMLEVIREVQPRWIVGENVYGLINWDGGMVFDQICLDLEAEGYQVQPIILPAVAVNAPHRRDRIWFVAYHNNRDRSEVGLQTRGEVDVHRTKGPGTPSDTIGSRHGGRTEKTGSDESIKDGELEQNKRHNGDEVRSKTERCSKTPSNSTGDGCKDGCKEAGGEERQGEQRGMQQSKGGSDKRTSPNPNSDGLSKQWGHDRCCEDDKGSNEKSIRRADTKDSDRCSSHECVKGSTGTGGGTCTDGHSEEDKVTNSEGVCRLDKEHHNDKGDDRIDGNKENPGGALVQKGQGRVQSSINRTLGDDQDSLPGNRDDGLSDDIPGGEKLDGDVTNPKSTGSQGGKIEGQHESHTGSERLSKTSITPNTGSKRLKGEGEQCIRGEEEQSKRKVQEQSHPNTCDPGFERTELNGTSEGGERNSDESHDSTSKLHKVPPGRGRGTWENFPTQSPVCSRDDELSSRLDNITFPKWRNESIKAYGNAVVPELVFQIFKVIEEMDSLNSF